MLGGKAFAMLAGLLTSVILARLLAVEQLGAYFLILSIVGVFAGVGQFGLGQAALLLVARALGEGRPEFAIRAARTILLLSVCAACGMSFAYWCVGNRLATDVFRSEWIKNFTWLIPFLIVFSILQMVLTEIFRGFHNIRHATIWGVITPPSLIFLGVLAGLLSGQISLAYVLSINLLGIATAAILATTFLSLRHFALFRKELIGLNLITPVSAPLFAVGLIGVVAQLDLWVVGWIFTERDAAIYGAAMKLVSLVIMPLTIVNGFLPPIIAELYAKGDKSKLERVLRISATLTGAPSLLFLIIFIAAAGPILGIVYGAPYKDGASILILLSLGHLINVLSGSCGYTLLMSGHQALVMRISLASNLVAVLVGVLMVKLWGVNGVAIAVALAVVLQNVLAVIFVKRRIGISTGFSFSYLSPGYFRVLIGYKNGRT